MSDSPPDWWSLMCATDPDSAEFIGRLLKLYHHAFADQSDEESVLTPAIRDGRETMEQWRTRISNQRRAYLLEES